MSAHFSATCKAREMSEGGRELSGGEEEERSRQFHIWFADISFPLVARPIGRGREGDISDSCRPEGWEQCEWRCAWCSCQSCSERVPRGQHHLKADAEESFAGKKVSLRASQNVVIFPFSSSFWETLTFLLLFTFFLLQNFIQNAGALCKVPERCCSCAVPVHDVCKLGSEVVVWLHCSHEPAAGRPGRKFRGRRGLYSE